MIISKWIDTKENEKAILDLARRVYSRSDIIILPILIGNTEKILKEKQLSC